MVAVPSPPVREGQDGGYGVDCEGQGATKESSGGRARSGRRSAADGYKFRRQRSLGRYVVDFVCFEERVIVELDGGQHAEQIAYDSKRDVWLESQSFRVLRF